MALIAIAILLAAILGFAAHRAGICTVRAVAEIMSSRGGYMFASIGKSMLWVLAKCEVTHTCSRNNHADYGT